MEIILLIMKLSLFLNDGLFSEYSYYYIFIKNNEYYNLFFCKFFLNYLLF